MDIIDNLRVQGVDEKLIEDVLYFRNYYGLEKDLEYRVTKSKTYFYGKDILSMCIAAILEEENILLSGPKATGKIYLLII